MLENYAERVRFVRSLTKLTREGFEKKYGISRSTLKSWELGVNTLTEKSAKLISDAIKLEGYSCTPEWLIFGFGSEPRPFNKDDDEMLLNDINQQAKIIYEADYFKKNHANSTVCMISDNSMYPNYQVGDYVGGICTSDHAILKKLAGSFCIISLCNKITLIRKLFLGKDNQYLLCPINIQFEADVVKKEDILSIACIIWYRTTIERHTYND